MNIIGLMLKRNRELSLYSGNKNVETNNTS